MEAFYPSEQPRGRLGLTTRQQDARNQFDGVSEVDPVIQLMIDGQRFAPGAERIRRGAPQPPRQPPGRKWPPPDWRDCRAGETAPRHPRSWARPPRCPQDQEHFREVGATRRDAVRKSQRQQQFRSSGDVVAERTLIPTQPGGNLPRLERMIASAVRSPLPCQATTPLGMPAPQHCCRPGH